MDFGLSEEQELLQETVRSYADNECPVTRLREIFDGDADHDPTLWRGLSEMGVAGLAIPETFGGAGLEVLDLALVAEVLGGSAFPGPFLGHALAGLALTLGGSDAQKEAWLPRLASGECVASVAFGEDGDRWQPEEWTASLADGALSGAKAFVPNAAAANVLIVGVAGGGLALVETGGPGTRVDPLDGLDRTRRTDRVVFDGAAAEALDRGIDAAPRVRDAGLVLLAADSFGAAWRLIRMTIEYCGARQQFGTPLTQFQAVKHELANHSMEIEQSRGLFWFAAHAVDRLPDAAPRAAAVAKAHITDRAMDAARACFELHGGIGYTWECDLQMWFKRVMFDRAFLGGPDAHRDRTAALAGW